MVYIAPNYTLHDVKPDEIVENKGLEILSLTKNHRQ